MAKILFKNQGRNGSGRGRHFGARIGVGWQYQCPRRALVYNNAYLRDFIVLRLFLYTELNYTCKYYIYILQPTFPHNTMYFVLIFAHSTYPNTCKNHEYSGIFALYRRHHHARLLLHIARKKQDDDNNEKYTVDLHNTGEHGAIETHNYSIHLRYGSETPPLRMVLTRAHSWATTNSPVSFTILITLRLYSKYVALIIMMISNEFLGISSPNKNLVGRSLQY